ncbi:tail fiber protein [Aggregatibacter actinomycetemcomitans serotype d str. SA2200]|nr:tail fiber protein [Aggregatibacter actinomycetemcomitans serotype d str. SA2200]
MVFFEIRRYPDGTMIQTYLIEQYDLKDWKEKSFNRAQAFVNTPLIFTKVTTSLDAVHDCDINVLTKSNNKTCYYREYEHGSADQGNVRIQFYAIGRWK